MTITMKPTCSRRAILLGCGLWLAALAAGHSGEAPPPGAALRAAVQDLITTYGDRYPGGASYLARLDAVLQQDPTATSADYQALQREALLANPLVTQQEILYTARPQYPAVYHAIDTLFQVGEATDLLFANRFLAGGALKALDVKSGKTRTLAEAPQGTVRSPCMHFDGKKLLFAMRRNAKENYHLFEILTDGSGLKQLTSAPDVSDFDPLYLPDGTIVFASTREPKYNMCSQDIGANLFRMDGDGANIHQITKSTLFENQPTLLADGRILYKRWEYVDRNFGDAHGFWTVNPDGTGQAILWGNNKADPGAVYYPRPIPGSHQLLCILGSHHGNMCGALAIIDPTIDTDRSASIVRTWPAAVRATLTDSDAFNCDRFMGVNPKYEDPFPLSNKYFLCSRAEPNGVMAIYLIDTFGNEVLVHNDGPGCFSAMPMMGSKRPPVSPLRRDYQNHDGVVYVTNVYEGTHMKGVVKGSVKKLRVVESPEKRGWAGGADGAGKWFGQGFQAPGMNWHDFTAKRILGTVPVEADGSAYFRVPSDTFLFFQLLDENDMMIHSMRSGTVLQSGERVGCIGCHEDRLASPLPQLVKPLAQQRAPSELQPWYGPPRIFGFVREVQPVLDRNCVRCHDFGKPAGKKLVLAGDRDPFFNAAYTEMWRKQSIKVIGGGPASIQQAYSWGSHVSPLVKVLREGHPAGGGGPSREQLKLSKGDFDRIVTWIDLNAPYYPTYYSAYPDSLGGRSPIDTPQLTRLGQLTGINWTEQQNCVSSTGPWLSFERPELSPCLTKLAKDSPAYQEALAIIRNGTQTLARQPRGDTADFTPCSKDQQREQFYQKRRQIEARNRNAIRTGTKVYD